MYPHLTMAVADERRRDLHDEAGGFRRAASAHPPGPSRLVRAIERLRLAARRRRAVADIQRALADAVTSAGRQEITVLVVRGE